MKQEPRKLARLDGACWAIAVTAIVVVALAQAIGTGQTAAWPWDWLDVALVGFLCLLAVVGSVGATLLSRGQRSWAAPAVAACALLLAPTFYVHVRTGYEMQRARRLVEQARLGEARRVIAQVLVVRPGAKLDGMPLAEAAERLAEVMRPIALRVQQPLAANAGESERLGRARDLAMLGREEEALVVLAHASLEASPAARNLLAAVREARGEWRLALNEYWLAVAMLGAASDAGREMEEAKALAGIGLCERKLGRLKKAEAAYQRLVAISPAAESHFLVAQFYEDTQQAALAAVHAREAARLAPEQFEQRGRQLVNKLTTSHFGCLGAFSGDSRLSSAGIRRLDP